jgi:cellulose synthase operon protein B
MKKMMKKITAYLVFVLLIIGGLSVKVYGAGSGTTAATKSTNDQAAKVETTGNLAVVQENADSAAETDPITDTKTNVNTKASANTNADADAKTNVNTKADEDTNLYTNGSTLTGTEDDAVNYLSVTDPENAADPDVTEPVYDTVSYFKDDFFSQKTLKGIYSSAAMYFYVPEYWDTKYVYAQIQYDVSQLIESTASSLTFAINDVPIQSYKLEYKNGISQILYVKIPMSEVKIGYNSFTISAYARLYNEEGCVDDYSDANWLSIEETSHIRSGDECKDPEHKISYYPYPFMSTYNPTGEGLTIAVSDQATKGEVATAMNLMADLSTDTVEDNDIQVCLLSDLARTNPTRTILVSNYDNLPTEYQQQVLKVPDSSQNTTVSFTDDTQGNPLLIITSMDDESLTEAAFMLMDASRSQQESGNVATVEKGSSQIAVSASKQSDMIAGNYTLEDIMGSGLTYVGPFHQENYVYLPVSKDFVLSDSGKVALKFRYSENLDFTRSLITVYWGDIPIASKRLKKENASGDELNFDMPSDIIGTTATSLKISFDLEIADMICTPRQTDMPWAYISKESTVFLPSSSDVTLSFDLKASPFRKDGKFNDILLVLSDNPTTNELNLLGQVVAMYGNEAEPYGSLTVRRVSEFSEEDADYNIMTVGTYTGNALISSLNDKLDFQYTSDGTAFKSNEQLILSKEYAGKIAAMQLLESPYALNRGLLVVTGSNEQALLNAQEYLRDSEQRSALTKDCVIIDPDLTLKAFQFLQSTTTQAEPTLAEKLVQNKKSLLFTAIATSAMFLMLLAVIIILLRINMYRKKNDR